MLDAKLAPGGAARKENVRLNDRPNTAAMLKKTAAAARPFTGAVGQSDALKGFKSLPGGNRAVSAATILSPKLKRYEDLTARLKKLLESEKRNLRFVKTMVATEIESRNRMEKMLRCCVDDVKAEIAKKRAEYKNNYCKSTTYNFCRQTGQAR